jgi:hypothetical protein
MVALVAMLLDALRDVPLATCAENAIVRFLEGEFNVLSSELARARGAPVSQTEARRRVASDPRWIQAVALVTAM